MMPGNVFRLQLLSAFADKRRAWLRIGVSALLAMPFIFIGMPSRAQAAGLVMVIVFTGFFGAAVGHGRLRGDARLARLSLLPTSRAAIWLDLVLAAALARLGPVLVILAVFVLVNAQAITAASAVTLLGWLCGSLLLLTLLGIATGQLARSNGEVHLFGALACGAVAFLSGVTPLPERLQWLQAAMTCNPISQLLAALTTVTAESQSLPGVEFVFASLLLGAVVATAIVRWTLGGEGKTKAFDTHDTVVNNRTP